MRVQELDSLRRRDTHPSAARNLCSMDDTLRPTSETPSLNKDLVNGSSYGAVEGAGSSGAVASRTPMACWLASNLIVTRWPTDT